MRRTQLLPFSVAHFGIRVGKQTSIHSERQHRTNDRYYIKEVGVVAGGNRRSHDVCLLLRISQSYKIYHTIPYTRTSNKLKKHSFLGALLSSVLLHHSLGDSFTNFKPNNQLEKWESTSHSRRSSLGRHYGFAEFRPAIYVQISLLHQTNNESRTKASGCFHGIRSGLC